MRPQSPELIRFISNINVASDGTVPINTLDDDSLFESDLYEAEYAVSVLSKIMLTDISLGKIEIGRNPIREGTLPELAINSDLSTDSSRIYLLIRLTVLECFSLVYSIEENVENLQFVSPRDIQRIKMNVLYLSDFMGTESQYHKLIEPLRHIYISLGYIEHQIDVIMQNGRLR